MFSQNHIKTNYFQYEKPYNLPKMTNNILEKWCTAQKRVGCEQKKNAAQFKWHGVKKHVSIAQYFIQMIELLINCPPEIQLQTPNCIQNTHTHTVNNIYFNIFDHKKIAIENDIVFKIKALRHGYDPLWILFFFCILTMLLHIIIIV